MLYNKLFDAKAGGGGKPSGDKTKLSHFSFCPCCVLQESSRTLRTSFSRIQRPWLASPICATVSKLSPGHSLCRASTTIRHACIESGGCNSQAAGEWRGEKCCGGGMWLVSVNQVILEFPFFQSNLGNHIFILL